MLAFTGTLPTPILAERLVRMLQDNLGLSEEAAKWAVVTWASALGLAGYASPSPSATRRHAAQSVIRSVPLTVRRRIDRLREAAVAAGRSSKNEFHKTRALTDAAAALAATDPDTAVVLLSQAERGIRESEQTESGKQDQLAEVAVGLVGLAKSQAAVAPGRAAQAFDQAERLAQSINSGTGGVSVIIAVANEVTTFDPDRAARLLADAAHRARSSSGFKAERLALVAAALAAMDPPGSSRLFDEAEHAARSADSRWRDGEIAGVVAAMAAIDADRAERLAQSIPEAYRASALAYVVRALAPVDPGRAERVARSITNDCYRDNALAGVALALAPTDLGRAVRLANSISGRSTDALAALTRVLTSSDPDGALRLAWSITDQRSRISILASIAVALEVTDPDRAARLVDDAERLAGSITNDGERAMALLDLARVLEAERAN